MPDYAEAAQKAGWVQDGSKWKHPKHPNKIYYNAIEVWNKELSDNLKRPDSITPPPAPPAPEPTPSAKAGK